MKKIKSTRKLTLNKSIISQLTNQEKIKGGRTLPGCGKTKLVNCIAETFTTFTVSVTCPTNPIRCGQHKEATTIC